MVRVTYLSFLIGLTKNIQNKDVSIPTVEIFKKLIVPFCYISVVLPRREILRIGQKLFVSIT